MSNSFRKPKGLGAAVAAVGAAVAFVAMVLYAPPANADMSTGDVHVCTGIVGNAAIVYDALVEHGPTAADEIIAEIGSAEELNPAQGYILTQGVYFLVQNWYVVKSDVPLNRKRFQAAAKGICEYNFGQIADRNNT